MKVKILVLFVSILYISCQNDDDIIQNEEPQTETIDGSWNLRNVYGGLMPTNIDYNIGEVKWTFIEADSSLIIENNIITTGPADIHAGLDSGTYSYEIQIDNNVQTLFVNGDEIGVITMTLTNLDIDNGLASDDYISEYERE